MMEQRDSYDVIAAGTDAQRPSETFDLRCDGQTNLLRESANSYLANHGSLSSTSSNGRAKKEVSLKNLMLQHVAG